MDKLLLKIKEAKGAELIKELLSSYPLISEERNAIIAYLDSLGS